MTEISFLTFRFCCLYCKTSKSEMQNPPDQRREDIQFRSLDSLQRSYQAYKDDGSHKACAKDVSHSVTAPAMIPVEIDHVRMLQFSISRLDHI